MSNLLNKHQVSELLGLSPATLRKWRLEGKGPRFLKLGHRVMYRMTDLETYLDQQVRISTTDTGEVPSCA